MAVTRISITIPEELVERADREARRLERSRSWLIADAVRRYLAEPEAPRPAGVREPGAPAYSPKPTPAAVDAAAELEAARQHRLAADLQLTPTERLRRAEELGRLGLSAQRRAPRLQVIGFSSYDDYYAWRRSRLVGAA